MNGAVLDWLLDSDPSIRWQVYRDLLGDTKQAEHERLLVARTGWGAESLSHQAFSGKWGVEGLETALVPEAMPDAETRILLRELHRIDVDEVTGFMGVDETTVRLWETDPLDLEEPSTRRYMSFLGWMQSTLGTYNPKWISTTYTLLLLHHFGIDPSDPQVRGAVDLVAKKVSWDVGDGPRSFFDGETEPCINGMVTTIGAYFGHGVDGVVDRLLEEQLADGGWNCEAERGSVRSSFDSTICVLEGLLEYERNVGPSEHVAGARRRGEQYLLERRMFRRLSSGDVVDPAYTMFSFPPRWHYDVLRGLDYMRVALDSPDPMCAEAVELVESKRGGDGRWLQENTHPGFTYFPMDDGDGRPSRWNTLRALRVLAWYDPA